MEEVNGIMKLFGEYLIMAYDYQKENNRVVIFWATARRCPPNTRRR